MKALTQDEQARQANEQQTAPAMNPAEALTFLRRQVAHALTYGMPFLVRSILVQAMDATGAGWHLEYMSLAQDWRVISYEVGKPDKRRIIRDDLTQAEAERFVLGQANAAAMTPTPDLPARVFVAERKPS